MAKMIWILGSPRSGTTFLTDYIGNYVDNMYNEPWKSHPLETPRTWTFPPQSKKIVFKYCENWRNIHILSNKYPDSLYVNVWRDPDNVVYSMAYPKEDSYPPRNLYGEHDTDQRVRLCMQRWFSNSMHCLSLYNILPKQYVEIQYENIKPGLRKLGEMAGIDFNVENTGWKNRNVEAKLNWELNPTARQLRNMVHKYDGQSSLAEFINKKRPKFLQRVVL